MSGTIRISLRAGERVYVNGAVIRVDRKTTLEFLNNVVFLLEQHVMQEEDATTALRKLYFTVQKMLITPAAGFSARQEFYAQYLELITEHHEQEAMVSALDEIRRLVNIGRNFEALKRIRRLCEAEDAQLGITPAVSNQRRRQAQARQAHPQEGGNGAAESAAAGSGPAAPATADTATVDAGSTPVVRTRRRSRSRRRDGAIGAAAATGHGAAS